MRPGRLCSSLFCIHGYSSRMALRLRRSMVSPMARRSLPDFSFSPVPQARFPASPDGGHRTSIEAKDISRHLSSLTREDASSLNATSPWLHQAAPCSYVHLFVCSRRALPSEGLQAKFKSLTKKLSIHVSMHSPTDLCDTISSLDLI